MVVPRRGRSGTGECLPGYKVPSAHGDAGLTCTPGWRGKESTAPKDWQTWISSYVATYEAPNAMINPRGTLWMKRGSMWGVVERWRDPDGRVRESYLVREEREILDAEGDGLDIWTWDIVVVERFLPDIDDAREESNP